MSDPVMELALKWLDVDDGDKSPASTFAQAYVAAVRDREQLQDKYARQYRELNDAQHTLEAVREKFADLSRFVRTRSEIMLLCDAKACDARLESKQLIDEDRIPAWAMAAGWTVTESKHFCPVHGGER